jgi:hypothetical protein
MTETHVSFRFPEEFFANDMHSISDRDREELFVFLRELQADPFSAGVMVDAEKRREVFARRVGDMVVYWKVKFSDARPLTPERIDVLKVVPAHQLKEKVE